MSPPPTWTTKNPRIHRISRTIAIVQSIDEILSKGCSASPRPSLPQWQHSYRWALSRTALHVLRRITLVLFLVQSLSAEQDSRRPDVVADVDEQERKVTSAE